MYPVFIVEKYEAAALDDPLQGYLWVGSGHSRLIREHIQRIPRARLWGEQK